MGCGVAYAWRVAVVMAVVVAASDAAATTSSDRYVRKIGLPDGQTVVIAEGDYEARSTGTYTVRLYASRDTAFYASGVILPRDGTIEDVRLADLDGSGVRQLVVIIRSAGTGGYLSAQALSFTGKRIEVRSHVSGLPKDADAVAALTRTTHVDTVVGKGKFHDPNGGAR